MEYTVTKLIVRIAIILIIQIDFAVLKIVVSRMHYSINCLYL